MGARPRAVAHVEGAPAELRAGTVVAERFVVERLAGAGGMGSVYAAHDRGDGSRVALKVMRTLAPEDAVRFVREAEVLRALSHPGIVRYVAHGSGGGIPFLAMEWVEGEDLGHRLARGPLAVEETVLLGRALADALAAVHERGIVHRDLKPSNVRLGAAGPVLVDFGVARANDLGPMSLTRTGAIVGTPLTMAPEQARGKPDVDARADVFALGAVLYECLTGTPAFAAASLVAVLARILLDSVPPPSERAAQVPPALDALVLRMLEKDPDARPASGAEVRALLDDLAAGVSITPKASLRRGLSLEETRYATCVVLRGASALNRTLHIDRTHASDRALQAVAASHGAILERLADGSLVALVLGGRRDEQVARATRCAIALRDLTGLAAALAAGKATTGGRIPVGDAIDRALEALEGAAEADVRVDASTADLLGGRFATTMRGDHVLVTAALEAAPRTVRGRATPFVGRRRELTSLAGLVAEAFDEGAARTALVVASPGLGKSRLASELALRIEDEHESARVVLVLADDALAGSPNAFARTLVRALLSFAPDDLDHAAFSRDLAGLPQRDADDLVVALVRPDAGARRARHVRALVALLRAVSAHGLALLLDDAQWIDAASASMLDEAFGQADVTALAVIAFSRPEGTPLWAGRNVEELRLSPLASRASEELARHVLGDAADAERVARAVEVASGHPLLLEELLRAGPGAVGDDVIALVQARIAQLAPESRLVMRAAAIMGAVSSEGAIASLLDRARASIRGAIDACVRAELLERAGPSGLDQAPTVRFRHALMRDAAYAMLTDEDRVLGHGLALAWLEAHGERDQLVLGEHAVRAARTPQDHASAGLRFCEAARIAPRQADAMAMLGRASEQVTFAAHSGTRLVGELARAQAYWLARGGSRAVAQARLDAAIVAARAAADHVALGALLPTRAWTLASAGDLAAGLADLAEAEALTRGDEHARFVVLKARSNLVFFTGDLELANELTDAVVAEAARLGLEREETTFMHNAAEWRIRAGRFDEAVPLLERSTRYAEQFGEQAVVELNSALSAYMRAVKLGPAMPQAELDALDASAARFAAAEITWEELTVRTFHAHALGRARGLEAARGAFELLLARALELSMPTYASAARQALEALDARRLPELR